MDYDRRKGTDLVPEAHRDPPRGEPESHLAGAVIGAAGGAAAGAVTGASLGGPLGAALGGAVGAVAGGAAGHAASAAVDPAVEDDYWRSNYMKRPYYRSSQAYSDYLPAYRYGWESASVEEFRHRDFQDVETELERGWERARGRSWQTWQDVREAVRDAWNRVRN